VKTLQLLIGLGMTLGITVTSVSAQTEQKRNCATGQMQTIQTSHNFAQCMRNGHALNCGDQTAYCTNRFPKGKR